MDIEVSVQKDERILEMDSGDGCTTLNILNAMVIHFLSLEAEGGVPRILHRFLLLNLKVKEWELKMAKAKQTNRVSYLSQQEISKTKELLYICTNVKINRTGELQRWGGLALQSHSWQCVYWK